MIWAECRKHIKAQCGTDMGYGPNDVSHRTWLSSGWVWAEFWSDCGSQSQTNMWTRRGPFSLWYISQRTWIFGPDISQRVFSIRVFTLKMRKKHITKNTQVTMMLEWNTFLQIKARHALNVLFLTTSISISSEKLPIIDFSGNRNVKEMENEK